VELAVDNDRNGEVSFADSTDDTTDSQPYRFWVNDDSDTAEIGESPSGASDSSDNEIKTKRDLEDFARLSFTAEGIEDQLKNGDIELGFKWKNDSDGPSLKLYWSAMSSGSKLYVEDDTEADLQLDAKYKTALGTISGNNPTYIDKKVFENIETDGAVHFLFEGVSEGEGELVTMLKIGSTESEGPGEWIELLPVEMMYQTVNATPSGGFGTTLEYGGNPPAYESTTFSYSVEGGFEAAWDETQNSTTFIHGWRTEPDESRLSAETMFKRLWWEGYKGRFTYFRWPTLTGNYSFSDSELRAWKYGSSLQSFLGDGVPGGYRKNVVAHSLGNVVVGGALKRGASIDTYVAMQAAIPAGCYDTNSSDGYFASKVTPDLSTPDKGYRGYLENSGVNIINYHNPDDYALVNGTTALFFFDIDTNWRKWQRDYKPRSAEKPNSTYGDLVYVYDPNEPSLPLRIYLLEDYAPIAGFLDEILRYVIDLEEAMSMVASSKSSALGATTVSQNVQVNRDLSSAAFGELTDAVSDHSGQFNRPIQDVREIYINLFEDIE
jgi:hypothetical protein